MARPIKVGLDYFPLDVTLEDKIELLEAECGLVGFAVLIKLWQKIYSNGYYIEWTEDNAMLFSRKINSDLTTVNNIINVCFKRFLLSKDHFDKYNILTSKGIQERYFKVCADSKRKSVSAIEQYLIVKTELMPVNTELTQINSAFSTQRKEEKSKEEERKEEESKSKWDSIIDSWNSLNLNELKSINSGSTRQKLISSRVKEHGLDEVLKAIDNINNSPFLKGQNDRGWTITFDWFIKPNNFIKVLEGNYFQNKQSNNNSNSVFYDTLKQMYAEEEGK